MLGLWDTHVSSSVIQHIPFLIQSLLKRWAVWIKEHEEFSWFKYKSYELEFLKTIFIYVYEYFEWIFVYAPPVCLMVRISVTSHIPWKWNYRQLRIAMWVLQMEPVSPEKAASILYSWAISPYSELDF